MVAEIVNSGQLEYVINSLPLNYINEMNFLGDIRTLLKFIRIVIINIFVDL